MKIVDSESMLNLGAALFKASTMGGIIFLRGNLGVGKTTLVRGFLHAANITQSIRSPTYTLMEHYQTAKFNVIHMDLYRLSDPEELEYLAVRELISDDTLFFIEWPERAEGFFRSIDLEIEINYHQQGRDINFIAHTEQAKQLIKALDALQLF